MVIVTGDVNVSRKVFGRHLVFPLHASIQERCRRIGFDNLAPIIWHKIANAQYEMGAGGFFGKPYEPNGIIKNDIEYILFERKGGAVPQPGSCNETDVDHSRGRSRGVVSPSLVPGRGVHPGPSCAVSGGIGRAAHSNVLVSRAIRCSTRFWARAPRRSRPPGVDATASEAKSDPEYFSLCIDRVRTSLAPAGQTALDLSV